MTQHEARELLKQYNLWRRGDCDGLKYYPSAIEIGKAIDTITQPNEIADSIRKAAIDWPQFLGDVECSVIAAFVDDYPHKVSLLSAFSHPRCSESLMLTGRTFLLFVAEALES